jgi:hypothetical protein
MKEELELRMYFFVPYNISPIQQAIQAGHAMGEYALQFGRYDPDNIIWDYLEKWKTWIILNGGTTNKVRDIHGVSQGTLNQLTDQLSLGDGISDYIPHAYFCEPDINDALTAVCFIVDERVWDYVKYPDLKNYILLTDFPDGTKEKYASFNMGGKNYEELSTIFPIQHKDWVKNIMGTKENVFLREMLKGKKLA